MEPVGTFQGLATGINFRDLVDQIIQAESAPITRMQTKTAAIDQKATAWGDFQAYVQTLADRAADLSDGSLFTTYLTSVTGMSSGSAPVSVSAGSSAAPGSFSVQVNQLATREKVAGTAVADATAALGYSGEFLVGGQAVTVSATDSLNDVAAALNQANIGTDASGVSAAVVAASGGGYRLVLTAGSTGAAGIDLRDGSAGVLRSLGFLDSTTAIKDATSDGAMSEAFTSSTIAVGTLLGLSSAASGSVTIGGASVSIDLSTDSLDDIAATMTGLGLSASVVTDTDTSGNTVHRLDISGTTSFTDDNHVLETLGVVEAGRGSVAQEVTSGSAFTLSDGSTAAGTGTNLTDLYLGGSATNAQAGDTLTLTGTRGDGTTFTKTVTIGTDVTTLGDLVTALNSGSDAFQAGSRTATASVVNGQLVVTDDTSGDSRLTLSIVTNNEGGGSLDFGDFSATATGRDREITAGQDAEFDVDGVYFSRSSNTVTDVVSGVTLSLLSATQEEVTASVERDVDGVVSGVESFIKAYNTVSEFVNGQFTGAGAEDLSKSKPLSGDAVLRQMRDQLRAALQETLSSSVTDVSRLSELGITLNREGTYDIDTTTLRSAVESDPLSVQRYFSVYGAGSTGSLSYIYASDATGSGTYDVDITTLAEQATVTGSVLGGTYVDDGTADVLSITDADTGSVYEISLTNGMSLAEIVDALNTELETATQRQIQGDALVDGVNPATDATTLDTLGVTTGDTLTFSGTDAGGSTFYQEWVVSDAATQTLGDVRAEMADALGSGVQVTIESGALTVTATDEGASSLSLSISSDAGGGTQPFGSFSVLEEGRSAMDLTASDVGGALSLTHGQYGASQGFDVAFTAGGTDGTAQLGITAGSYRGVDVVGTIGAQSATGAGRILTADADTSAEGMVVSYTGTSTGAVGSVTFSRGIASLMDLATSAMLDSSDGSLKAVTDALDTQKQGINDRIDQFQARLDGRQEFLIKKFSALEEAMAKAQSQMSWLQAQLGSLSNQSNQ